MTAFETAATAFVFLTLTGSVMIVFSLLAAYRYKVQGAIPYAGLCLSVAIYTIFYAREIISPTVQAAMIWSKLQYIGIATIPAWAMIFSLQYSGYQPGRSIIRLVWPWIFPILVIIGRFTNEYHHLVYREVEGHFFEGLLILEIKAGLLYWLNVAYINLMLLVSVVILVRLILHNTQTGMRRKIYLMLAGFSAPWFAHVIYQAGFSPMGTDITPYGFAVTGVFLGYALFVHRIFETAPLVRNEVFRSLRDGIIVTDTEFIIIEVNPSANAFFGSITSPLLGKHAIELFKGSEEMNSLIKDNVSDLIAALKTRKGERSFLVRKSILHNQTSEYLGNILIFSDVTENLEIENALHAKTTELESYFSNSVDMLCLLNLQGQVLHTNPAWNSTMGYSAEDTTGLSILSLVHSLDQQRVIEQMQKMSQNRGIISCQARFRTADNKYKWLDWRINATGNTLYASIRDITKRVFEQESLQKLLSFSEEFLQHPVGKINYTMICEHFAALSRAKLVMLFIHPEDANQSTPSDLVCTVISEHPHLALAIDQDGMAITHDQAITSGGLIALFPVSDDDPMLSLVRSRIDTGELSGRVHRLTLRLSNRVAGEFVFYSDDQPFIADRNILGLFARQTGLLLARMAAEETGVFEKAYFENLFDSSPAGIVILDAKDKVIRANTEFYRMFGFDETEVIGQQINDLIVPAHLKAEGSKITEAVALGKIIQYKTERQRKNGELFSVSILGKPMQLLDGETQVYGIYIDISEQIQTEQTLKKRQLQLQHSLDLQRQISEIALELNARRSFDERIERVLRNIGRATEVSRVYIFENDPDNQFTCNTYEWCAAGIEPQISQLQNIPFDEIEAFRDILVNEGHLISANVESLDEATRAILEPQGVKAIVIYSLWVDHRFFGFIGYDECSGTRIWTDAELELLRAVSAIIANAYERREIEKDLLEERDRANFANIAKSEFLANMSHEIRTPMNAILGFSESLYEQLKDSEHKSMLNSVLSSGRSLLSLLNDILDLSKIEAGKLELVAHPIQLRSMIGDIITLFNDKATRKGIGLYLNIPDHIPLEISLDEIRLKQVLFNLIGNAVKFTHQGYVQVSIQFEPTEGQKGRLSFLIQDTGIGIPADQLVGIFDTFIQVSGRANRSYEGTGLGLTISKRLVERMNGEILVESNEGIGSIFTLILNEVEYTNLPQVALPDVQEVDSPTFSKSKVVIIDDVESNILLMEGILTTLGLEIATATNGIAGLNLIREVKPDVVILDIRMPDLDGFQVARMLKEDTTTAHIPILGYTAALIELRSSAEAHLFDGIVVKPIVKKDLLAELRKFIHTTGGLNPKTEDKADQLIDQDQITLPDPDSHALILEILHTEYLPVWESVNDQLVLYKIEAFANSLKEMATTHHFSYLEQYAERLLEEVNNLNLDQIQDVLRFFPVIIQKLSATN